MNQIIFSANADSIDSWDMENLKYLRKLSIRNPETLSYISDRDEDSLNSPSPPLKPNAKVLTPHPNSKNEGPLEERRQMKPVLTSTTLPRDVNGIKYEAPKKSVVLEESRDFVKSRLGHNSYNTSQNKGSFGKGHCDQREFRNASQNMMGGEERDLRSFPGKMLPFPSREERNFKLETVSSEPGEIIPKDLPSWNKVQGLQGGNKYEVVPEQLISEFQPAKFSLGRDFQVRKDENENIKRKRSSVAFQSLEMPRLTREFDLEEVEDKKGEQMRWRDLQSLNLKNRRKSVALVNLQSLDKDSGVGTRFVSLGGKDDGRQPASRVLDDCYVMDVVMLRNESVTTDSTVNGKYARVKGAFQTEDSPIRIRELIERREKSLLNVELSASSDSPTPSASPSSDDSFTSAIEKGFFDMDRRSLTGSSQPEDEGSRESQRCSGGVVSFSGKFGGQKSDGSGSARTSEVSAGSLLDYIRVNRATLRRMNNSDDGCPLCGGCGRSDSFQYQDTRHLPDKGELEGVSMAPTFGGEPPPIDMPKTPSPYYMRLGARGAFPPQGFGARDVIQPPMNFSLNPNGNLVIDYSSNWSNLESYVQTLSMTDLSKIKGKGPKSLKSSHSD